VSWLKPYIRTWYKAYPDSVPPMKQLAHYIKPLLKAHAEARIVDELAGYLENTPPRFINLQKFAATFGGWAKRKPPPPKAPTTKRVLVERGGRLHLLAVPLDDPRPAHE
jgi:hypothetical protein